MSFLRATWHAFLVYLVVTPALVLFWVILLGPGMSSVWPSLPDGWKRPVGAGLLAFALLSGVAGYFAALAMRLSGLLQLGSWSAAPLHLLASGVLPLLVSAGLVWLVIANMRLGW
jgi:hypothetical protein